MLRKIGIIILALYGFYALIVLGVGITLSSLDLINRINPAIESLNLQIETNENDIAVINTSTKNPSWR